MIKILFVCHGNICRSPMAEFIMKQIVDQKGLADSFYISSAAMHTDAIGSSVYPPARRKLNSRGIDCSAKRARLVVMQDYLEYDFIIGMDRYNMRDMTRFFGGDPDGKLSLLLDHTGEHRDVADPWYTDDFDATEADVENGCNALLKHIIEKMHLKY
ncbi:MAG: low molecular weight phosphotyrosine protein phosphatase [Clostridia bacterium]|nr:low molecular weight phosphotyrosine protein phosphatase [Clostridia bacterium]